MSDAWLLVCTFACLPALTFPRLALTALGESDDDEAQGSSAAAASRADASTTEGGSGKESASKPGVSENLRLAGLTHKADKKTAGAAPTASFHEKREIAPVFDEFSPGFDTEKYAAAEKKVKAEKVCSQLIQLILPCSVAMLSTYPRMNSCRTNSYRLPASTHKHMCSAHVFG